MADLQVTGGEVLARDQWMAGDVDGRLAVGGGKHPGTDDDRDQHEQDAEQQPAVTPPRRGQPGGARWVRSL
jgi:hypothetical protein